MSPHEIRARGDTQCQYFKSLFEENMWMSKKRKVFVNPLCIKVYSFRIKSIRSKYFLKMGNSILSAYLHHLGEILDK